MNRIRIGCIADDFTGASDVASFLEEEGMRTMLISGVPKKKLPQDIDAVVIALKTRTAEKNSAVSDTLEALEYLKKIETEKYYIKYCSTFDSTSEGNIGPIVDAVMDELGVRRTVLCPSLLINGRKVIGGNLYVNGQLLAESSMKNHPLTPMNESEIRTLMESQSQHKVYNLESDLLMGNESELLRRLAQIERENEKYYLVPDYYDETHGDRIIELFGDDVLFTGGSGLIVPLSRKVLKDKTENIKEDKILLLSGSCSSMTLKQIDSYKKSGKFALKIAPEDIMSGEVTVDTLWLQVSEKDEVLVYSSEDNETRMRLKTEQYKELPALLESVMAKLAVRAVEAGFKAVVVAGGETSGAVTKSLDISDFYIGKSISPGIPVLLPKNEGYRLILKSGNFGDESFFIKAIQHLRNKDINEEQDLEIKLKETIDIAKSLFNRGKTSGTSANISFRQGDHIYISCSGSCFGTLKHGDFAKVHISGEVKNGIKPSKELPMHLALYQNDPDNQAVIHTHAFYSTLWSCLDDLNQNDSIPEYTPYLKMKLGNITLIPYEKPGSAELFEEFRKRMTTGRGYLLKNHGPVVTGKNMYQAFEGIEELEESARMAWYLRNEKVKRLGGRE